MKSLFASKTFWFNVVSGLTMFFAMPEIKSAVPAEYLVLATAVVNIILRIVTTEPVKVMTEAA